jgi:hypothetical protein
VQRSSYHDAYNMQVILSDILMAKKSKRSLALTGTLQFFGFGKKNANGRPNVQGGLKQEFYRNRNIMVKHRTLHLAMRPLVSFQAIVMKYRFVYFKFPLNNSKTKYYLNNKEIKKQQLIQICLCYCLKLLNNFGPCKMFFYAV